VKNCLKCNSEIEYGRKNYCNKEQKFNCINCNSEYRKICNHKTPKTCSRKCASQYGVKNKLTTGKCLNCNIELPLGRKKYCGSKRKIKCLICNNEFTSICDNNFTVTCSRSCGNKLNHQNRKFENICKDCGNVFITKKKLTDYCCQKIRKLCKKCNNEYVYTCGNINSKSYILCISCRNKGNKTQKEKKCKICEEEFVPSGPTGMYCKKTMRRKCLICNKEYNSYCHPKIFFFCSKECSKISNRLNLEKSMMNKYGATNTFDSLELKEKAQNEMMRKYGVKFGFQSEEIKEKAKEIMINKYGVETYFEHKDFISKRKENSIKKYGADHHFKNKELMQRELEKKIKNRGNPFGSKTVISKINQSFAKEIQSKFKGVKIEYEKSLDGVIFDLFLPEHNFLIEINPTVTHNSTVPFACLINQCDKISCKKHKPIDRFYHYNKSMIAMKNNMYLLHIYDWDSKEKILNFISGKISKISNKISSKKLICKKITQKEANIFLNLYHIQGAAKNQIYCYGLYLDNTLLSVATFGKSRFNENYQFEFIRYAVKKEWIIYGASGRMLSKFIKEVNPKTIISYLDFNHTTIKNTFLNTCNFIEKKPTGPILNYTKKNTSEKIPMSSLLKLGANNLIQTNYNKVDNPHITNQEIMIKEGYVEIYTSGNRIFVWSGN